MARVLTSRFVETVKVDARVEFPDASLPGFALRVTKEGSKSFTYRYRENGSQKRKSWKCSAYSLSEARGEAEAIARALDRGEDVDASKNALNGQIEAIEGLCDLYVKWLEKNVRKWKAAKGEVENHVRPHLGDYLLGKVNKSHVREMINKIEFPVAKNRALSRTRAMFNWGIDNDLCTVDPTHGIKKPTKEKPRGRILSDEELGKIWNACDQLDSPAREYFKFLILCGQRRDDVRLMHRREIRGSDWVIPAERYKGKREHLVPLTEEMSELVKGTGFIFSCDQGEKAYGNIQKPKTTLDRMSGLTNWTPHDLRRTLRTGLSRLGIRPDIAERVIGHAVGGKLGETYDLYSYRDEKLEALKKWGEFIKNL